MGKATVDGAMIYATVAERPGGKLTVTFLPAIDACTSAVGAVIDMTPADAIALAEALEAVARPLLPGGVPTFRDAMMDALGGGE